MKPRHYVDFVIADADKIPARAKGDGAGLPSPVIAGAALKALHGVFGNMPGRYALALPNHQKAVFATLRVFAGERDHLDELVQALENHPVIRDYTRIGYPRKIPAEYDGTWVEFRRYRIPSRKAGRKADDTLRERRMHKADTDRLPFFILQSRSTGQQFGLYLEIKTGADASSECAPDSYGLSVSSRPFALPDLA